MSNLEGAILSDYLLLQCISKGDVADVYRARQNGEGNHEVAAKVFRPTFAGRAAFREYFMTEAEKIGQFEHPNILPLLEFGEGEDLLYVVMPYVATGTLDDLLRRVGGRLSALQALPVMQQLCSVIQYAHNQGIIHGNLKLSNIFVAADGRILLSDFGIVRNHDDSQQSLTRVVRASAEYAAPEQSLGVLNRASDIYSLGALLFRLLAGQPPFTGQTSVEILLKHVQQVPPSIRSLVPGISDAVDRVLRIALQKRAEDRFVSIEEFGNAFYAAVTIAPVAFPLARSISMTNPLTPPVALPSPPVEPRTPIPAGRVQAEHLPAAAGPQTPAPPMMQAHQIAQPHVQNVPRITKQLSPSFSFEGNDASNGSEANHMADQNEPKPQQPYFEPGIMIGRQHFWSAEPVEWSPIGNLQGNASPRNEIPLHASTYLQDKADAKPATGPTPVSSHQQSHAPGASLDVAVPMSRNTSAKKRQETNEEHQSAFALALRKFLPIIVVILLLLGLIGALLSSAFFPAGSSGADIAPLHSVSGMIGSFLMRAGS